MLIHLAQSYWMKPEGAQIVLSPTQPAAQCFSSSQPCGGQGTEISDPPLPDLSREGREKGWFTIYISFPLLSFWSVPYRLCFSSGAHTSMAMSWRHCVVWLESFYRAWSLDAILWVINLLWVRCDSFGGWPSFGKQRGVCRLQWCWDHRYTHMQWTDVELSTSI